MGLFLKKRVEMPDKMILGNTEFVFDRKLGFHVGEWIVWDRKTNLHEKHRLSVKKRQVKPSEPLRVSLWFLH